jgi:hypothetical protein
MMWRKKTFVFAQLRQEVKLSLEREKEKNFLRFSV